MEVICPNCETSMLIEDEQLGLSHECPACGNPMPIPELSEQDRENFIKSNSKKAAFSPEDTNPELGRKMLEEPATEITSMWKERLANSFHVANFAEENQDYESYELHREAETLVTYRLDRFLHRLRFKTPGIFDEYYRVLVLSGAYSLNFVALIVLALGIILYIREDSYLLIFGCAGFFAAFVLHYLSFRFSRAGLKMIRSQVLKLYSYDVINAFGLLSAVTVLALCFAAIFYGIREKNFLRTLLLMVPALASGHAAVLFQNPGILNAGHSPEQATPGETGLAIVAYIMRLFILLAGVLQCAIPVLTFMLVWILVRLFLPNADYSHETVRHFVTISYYIAGIALCPMFFYLLYLAYSIGLDFYNTVLSMRQNNT